MKKQYISPVTETECVRALQLLDDSISGVSGGGISGGGGGSGGGHAPRRGHDDEADIEEFTEDESVWGKLW